MGNMKPTSRLRPAPPVNIGKKNIENRNENLILAINHLNQAIGAIVMDACKCTDEYNCYNCDLIEDIKVVVTNLYKELNKENRVHE
ncbi:hypothetical protein [Clostridium sp.]|uniref:hypothetical protein n=1 Tax=Clostridium sp. TaxID=1506 RepID=UPI00399429B3